MKPLADAMSYLSAAVRLSSGLFSPNVITSLFGAPQQNMLCEMIGRVN